MTIAQTWLEDRVQELTAAMQFCTRLPMPHAAPRGGVTLAKAAWAFPIAGILIGFIGAVVFVLARRIGLPPWPAAALAVAATVLATGCLHEDGLADTADGFGGGKSREQKLDIMRDSRIGTYGVCALTLSLLLRIGVLASFPDTRSVVWALIAAHGAARATLPVLMFLLPPARGNGLAFEAGQPPGDSVTAAAVLGFLILLIFLHPLHGIVAFIFLLIVLALLGWLAMRQIDGQTGDVLGALEQVSEIAVLLVALG
jgi:adenosylcobinamide-GDP ribazoletransferase